MKWLFLIAGVLVLLDAASASIMAKSAIHEIEVLLLVLISVVFICTFGLIRAIEKDKKEEEPIPLIDVVED